MAFEVPNIDSKVVSKGIEARMSEALVNEVTWVGCTDRHSGGDRAPAYADVEECEGER